MEIFFQEGTHPRDGRRQFRTIPDRRESFARVETVDAGEGVRIHYLYDPCCQDSGHNKSISGSITSSVSTGAIVYRGEMYDERKGRKWAGDAPAFGIPFGARHISVHVELSVLRSFCALLCSYQPGLGQCLQSAWQRVHASRASQSDADS